MQRPGPGAGMRDPRTRLPQASTRAHRAAQVGPVPGLSRPGGSVTAAPDAALERMVEDLAAANTVLCGQNRYKLDIRSEGSALC